MSEEVPVRYRRVSEHAAVPRVMQAGDVAADLFAAREALIPARGRGLVDTDLVLELPEGYRARIHSRSGLALKHGIEVGAGLIDQGFRDPVRVLLHNHSEVDFAVSAGDRIAQLCIERYWLPRFEEVDEVEQTGRTPGWGSTGWERSPAGEHCPPGAGVSPGRLEESEHSGDSRNDRDRIGPAYRKVLVIPFRDRGQGLEVLLLHRPAPHDFWQPVTGGVEAGESCPQAALRELSEETGMSGELLDLELTTPFRKGAASFEEACFAARVPPGAEPTLSCEHDASSWLPGYQALDRLRWEGNRNALHKLISLAGHEVRS